MAISRSEGPRTGWVRAVGREDTTEQAGLNKKEHERKEEEEGKAALEEGFTSTGGTLVLKNQMSIRTSWHRHSC